MQKRVQTVLMITGALFGLLIASTPASAQSDDKMSEQSTGGKMSHQEMMDKMNKMSADDKAAMFDKMTKKDQMMATKMAGHDMSKMSESERMDMMGKMSMQDKAAAFDKMPMSKKMAMMNHSDSMTHDDSKKMSQ